MESAWVIWVAGESDGVMVFGAIGSLVFLWEQNDPEYLFAVYQI
jgi:hypothetical protein